MIHLNQYWRVLATGFCFSVFGLGGLVLSFIVIPTIRIFVSDQTEREYKVQGAIRYSFNTFCKLMKLSGAIDYQIIGADILQQDRNCLIVANHPSLIDYVLIASQLNRCDCLVKSAIWSNPFMKHIVKAAGYIPNEAPDDLLALCDERFNKGNVLLIFPEGTRTTPGVEPKLQRGAAQIAVRTERDLRVVHITVTPSSSQKRKMVSSTGNKAFFRVEVKDKVEITPFIKQTTSPTIAARRLQQHLAENIFPENFY
ncbi:LOW QUALITY PROTEIN: 1-acyl-SN-glycerol-3-phosphate acyltransferase [Vibrio sp. JCM 18904]|nr:LOW QUALITY PROTEIN: 1-acyl-SN-glycerol-3-phosphate acyltransferase [Vibrio sp. JCM 18904]